MKVRSCIGLLWSIGACYDAFDPPPGTSRFYPPPVYYGLWAEVEACSGLNGELGQVRWFTVPLSPFPCPDGSCRGFWEWPHTIYIGAASVYDSSTNYFTVRHEMLHDLLRHGLHGDPAFHACNLQLILPRIGGQ